MLSFENACYALMMVVFSILTPCVARYIMVIRTTMMRVVSMDSIGLLFSSKVGGNFTPVVGIPFAYFGGVSVGLQPRFGAANIVPQLDGLIVKFQFAAAFFAFDPVDGIDGVAIDNLLEVVLFEIGKSVDDGQELADIVGADGCFVVEYLLSVGDIYSLVFHDTWITTTGGVDC